jgi:hypothetical protein
LRLPDTNAFICRYLTNAFTLLSRIGAALDSFLSPPLDDFLLIVPAVSASEPGSVALAPCL